MDRPRFLFLLAGASALTLGCGGPSLADTVDWTLDFDLTITDELHSPYVRGSQFTVYALGLSEEEERHHEVRSADNDILSCLGSLNAEADCTAASQGEVDLEITRDGEIVHATPVEVVRADAAWAFPRAALMAAHGLPTPATSRIRILQGGTATFQVVFTGHGERLSGAGSMDATAPAGVAIDVERTLLFEDRDWLQITPAELGEHEVTISSAGDPVSTVRIEVVDASAVDSIVLAGAPEEGARDGDTLTIVGVARGEDGVPIYGVDFDWDLDGVAEPGEGDLFRYVFDRNRRRTVTAHFGDKAGSLGIHAESGYVDSTNNLGCAVAPGASGRGLAGSGPGSFAWAAGALGLAALAFARRRGGGGPASRR